MSTQSHISTNQQYNAFSVLVVDDELGMQAILKKALGKLFSQVDTAGSIEEAEELFADHKDHDHHPKSAHDLALAIDSIPAYGTNATV